MELEDNELTFDMIGNMSEEEIDNELNEEIITDDDSPFLDINDDNDDEETVDDQEGVGDEDQEDLEDAANQETDVDDGSSPNIFASIAKSLHTDGILTLDESNLEGIKDADALASLFQKQIESMLEDKYKRVDEALSNDIPIDIVKQYENVLHTLDNITEESIRNEDPEGEQIRKDVIIQDYLNKGFSQEKALRMTEKSFDAGTDVEDALEALKDNKDFFNKEYNSILNEAKIEKENKVKEQKEANKKLETLFLNTEEPIKGVKLSESERKKVYSQYTKFIDKDENDNPLNAIQKYAKDNPIDYQYNINLLYYLTDGFKNIGKVVNKEVKTKTKSALSNIESVLNNPNHGFGGGMNFKNDTSPDSKQGFSVLFD